MAKAQAIATKAVYDVPEVAKLLGTTRLAVYRLVSSRALPSIRIGRKIVVPHNAFEEWLTASQGKSFPLPSFPSWELRQQQGKPKKTGRKRSKQ